MVVQVLQYVLSLEVSECSFDGDEVASAIWKLGGVRGHVVERFERFEARDELQRAGCSVRICEISKAILL
jgi:hypothetical protein